MNRLNDSATVVDGDFGKERAMPGDALQMYLLGQPGSLHISSDGSMLRIPVDETSLPVFNEPDLPIYRLPREIVCHIFRILITNPLEDREKTLLALSSTCRLWRDIVAGCPHLWRTLSSKYSSGFNGSCIDRSKNLDLELILAENEKPHLHDEAILDWHKRVRVITLRGDDVSLLVPYLPNVVELSVVLPLRPNIPEKQYCLHITAGSPFRVLDLYGIVLVNCDWARMKNIQILHLERVVIAFSGFLSHLLHALSTAVNLKKLVIAWVREARELAGILHQPHELAPPIVHLPTLQVLEIYAFWRCSYSKSIMYHISAPDCGQIALGRDVTESEAWDWLEKNLPKSVWTANEMWLKLDPKEKLYHFRLQIRDGKCFLVVGCDSSNLRERLSTVGCFLKNVGWRPDVRMNLVDIDERNPLVIDIPYSVLESLGNLVTIDAGRGVDVIPVVRSLGSKKAGRGRWACPKLEFISLTCSIPEVLHEASLFPERWEAFWPEDGSKDLLILNSISA